MREPAAVGELLAAYAATAQRWHDLRTDARAANLAFDENALLASELRASQEGRVGIATLIDHPAGGVRVLAAAHSLDVDKEISQISSHALFCLTRWYCTSCSLVQPGGSLRLSKGDENIRSMHRLVSAAA